jgi:hypothetical protein
MHVFSLATFHRLKCSASCHKLRRCPAWSGDNLLASQAFLIQSLDLPCMATLFSSILRFAQLTDHLPISCHTKRLTCAIERHQRVFLGCFCRVPTLSTIQASLCSQPINLRRVEKAIPQFESAAVILSLPVVSSCAHIVNWASHIYLGLSKLCSLVTSSTSLPSLLWTMRDGSYAQYAGRLWLW